VVRRALPALSVPVVIMAGIVLGWMTPTEAAAVAVVVSTLIGLLYRTLSRSVWRESVERTVELTGTIFIAMAAAAGVNLLATLTQLPVELAARITALGLGLQGYMLLLTLVLLVTGMFLDTQIALSLMVPILAPVATHLGADPVHVGVMVCITLSIGLITPPLGGVTMVTATITGVPYWRLVRATMPFVLLELLFLLLVVLMPDVTLFLPRHLGLMP
jgi:tripartite ATP-independent transporter DctM subunit